MKTGDNLRLAAKSMQQASQNKKNNLQDLHRSLLSMKKELYDKQQNIVVIKKEIDEKIAQTREHERMIADLTKRVAEGDAAIKKWEVEITQIERQSVELTQQAIDLEKQEKITSQIVTQST